MNADRAIPDAARPRSYNDDMHLVGKAAEEKVLAWIRSRPEIVGVVDLRDLKPLQNADADFLVYTLDGRTPFIEVKSDWNLGVSGNVLFEVLRINHTCHPERACVLGWSARTPATYLFYYAAQLNAIYRCRPDDLRRAFQNYSRDYRKLDRGINLKTVCTDEIKTTIIALIPWKYCEKSFTKYQLTP